MDTFQVIWGRREYRVRVVSFNVHPGCAAVGPAYSHGGIPGEPASVEDVVLESAEYEAPLPFDFYELDDDEQAAIEAALLQGD